MAQIERGDSMQDASFTGFASGAVGPQPPIFEVIPSGGGGMRDQEQSGGDLGAVQGFSREIVVTPTPIANVANASSERAAVSPMPGGSTAEAERITGAIQASDMQEVQPMGDGDTVLSADVPSEAVPIPNLRPRGRGWKTATALSTVFALTACAPAIANAPERIRVETVLPGQLPEGVAAQLSAGAALAVGMRIPIRAHDANGKVIGEGRWEPIFGSAVMINNDTALTAEHAVPHPDCGDLEVVGKTGPTVHKSLVHRVANAVGSNGKPDPDVALIEINPADLAGIPIPPRRLGPPLKVGDAVYVAGFQPADDGVARSPSQPEPYSYPSVTGAIVVDTDGQRLIIATGLHGYGPRPQVDVGPGDSGGPVFDGSGNVVGAAVDMIQTEENGEEIAEDPQELGVELAGYPPDQKVTLALIQPFTPGLIEKTQEELKEAPPCQRRSPMDILVPDK